MEREIKTVEIWTRVCTVAVNIPVVPYEFETAIVESLGRKLRAIANLLVNNKFPKEDLEAAMKHAVENGLWVQSTKVAYKNIVVWHLGNNAPRYLVRAIF